ncbi:MAG: hypothetical protein FIA97_15230, partial [Methylococcaceae bacterium]|nr:hypothetical protein [Methylococcaceae bacterium]
MMPGDLVPTPVMAHDNKTGKPMALRCPQALRFPRGTSADRRVLSRKTGPFRPENTSMTTAIVWFRRDLRLTDNPALSHALSHSERIIPVYISDPEAEAPWQPGAASRWWLHHSLKALADALSRRGSPLIIRRGASLEQLRQVVDDCDATAVYWNRLYEPALIERDRRIKQSLREQGCQVASFGAALLREPWEVNNGAGQPYRVFTPFWKRLQQLGWELDPLPAPAALTPPMLDLAGLSIDQLGLLPRIVWDEGLRERWSVGEESALARLDRFLDLALAGYPDGRDRPALAGTSELSPHLHFGEIGPRQIVAAIEQRLTDATDAPIRSAAH